jgi:hypothetical protein
MDSSIYGTSPRHEVDGLWLRKHKEIELNVHWSALFELSDEAPKASVQRVLHSRSGEDKYHYSSRTCKALGEHQKIMCDPVKK